MSNYPWRLHPRRTLIPADRTVKKARTKSTQGQRDQSHSFGLRENVFAAARAVVNIAGTMIQWIIPTAYRIVQGSQGGGEEEGHHAPSD